jgi:hypothetical protein
MKMQFPDRVSYDPLHFGETDWECEQLISQHDELFQLQKENDPDWHKKITRDNYYNKDPFKTGIRLQDVHIMRVAPMDENGYFNFGISNACMLGWCIAHKVIVEVNKNMPIALGGARESIHVSQVDYIVESDDDPLFELPNIPATDLRKKLQNMYLNISMTDAACNLEWRYAKHSGTYDSRKRPQESGGHTEMLVDAFMEMELSGR